MTNYNTIIIGQLRKLGYITYEAEGSTTVCFNVAGTKGQIDCIHSEGFPIYIGIHHKLGGYHRHVVSSKKGIDKLLKKSLTIPLDRL